MEKIDRYALLPRLQFQGKYAHSTSVGGIMTLIIVILTALSLVIFSQDFLYKQHPSLNSSESNFKDIPVFEIGVEQLTMGFYLLFNHQFYINDPSLYTINAYQRSVSVTENKTINTDLFELELEPCTSSHFPEDENIRNSFQELGILSSMCLKKNQMKKPVIAGIWGQSRYDTLFFKYNRCVNSSKK